MADSLKNGLYSPRRDRPASCSLYCSFGARRTKPPAGCRGFQPNYIVIGGDQHYETKCSLSLHGRGDGDRQGDGPAGPAGTPGLHRPPPGQPVPHHQGDGQPPHQGPPHLEAVLQRQGRGRHHVFAGVLRQGFPGSVPGTPPPRAPSLPSRRKSPSLPCPSPTGTIAGCSPIFKRGASPPR